MRLGVAPVLGVTQANSLIEALLQAGPRIVELVTLFVIETSVRAVVAACVEHLELRALLAKEEAADGLVELAASDELECTDLVGFELVDLVGLDAPHSGGEAVEHEVARTGAFE